MATIQLHWFCPMAIVRLLKEKKNCNKLNNKSKLATFTARGM